MIEMIGEAALQGQEPVRWIVTPEARELLRAAEWKEAWTFAPDTFYGVPVEIGEPVSGLGVQLITAASRR
jgi:hypothetical protein